VELAPSRSLDAFLEEPDGRYFAGSCFFTFCVRDGVTGSLLWGLPTRDGAAELVRSMPSAGPGAMTLRRPRYLDLRYIDGIETGALELFATHVAAQIEAYQRIVTKFAVVHRGGLGLAMAAGFSSLSQLPSEVALFSTPESALSWLGVRGPDRLAQEIDALHARLQDSSPVVLALHAVLAADLQRAEIDGAARALGQSVRTLQRKLRLVKTTFQTELARCRVHAAKRMLEDRDRALGEIARELGFSSQAHLSTLFRRHAGMTPREGRARFIGAT